MDRETIKTLNRLRTPGRRLIAKEFLDFIASIDLDERSNSDEISRKGHLIYTRLLERMRDELGLSLLQPGRFVMPDGKGDRPVLWFFPVDPPQKRERGTGLRSILADRYSNYCSKIVEPFFRETFARTNRQVVLVDLLTALNKGPDAFDDTCQALDAALDALGMRTGGILSKLIPRRFDKVLFGVTKADHVPASQRGNLAALLEDITGIRAMAARTAGANEISLPLASVCCTQDEKISLDIGEVDVVVGKPIDGEKRLKIYPGVIPTYRPSADFWDQKRIHYPVFCPPVLKGTIRGGIPNINIGRVLEFLLEDVLK